MTGEKQNEILDIDLTDEVRPTCQTFTTSLFERANAPNSLCPRDKRALERFQNFLAASQKNKQNIY